MELAYTYCTKHGEQKLVPASRLDDCRDCEECVREIGRQITDEINSDPAEVARLRKSRQQVRSSLDNDCGHFDCGVAKTGGCSGGNEHQDGIRKPNEKDGTYFAPE